MPTWNPPKPKLSDGILTLLKTSATTFKTPEFEASLGKCFVDCCLAPVQSTADGDTFKLYEDHSHGKLNTHLYGQLKWPKAPINACGSCWHMPPAHSHVVCMHSYCWSYWTSSISYCWTCLPFQLRRPAAFPIHSIRGTVLVLYWVCSDGLCACVCSVSLRGFRALRRTLVLLYRAVRPPRYHLVAFCARVHLRPVTPLGGYIPSTI